MYKSLITSDAMKYDDQVGNHQPTDDNSFLRPLYLKSRNMIEINYSNNDDEDLAELGNSQSANN